MDDADAGFIMLAEPQRGDRYYQEFAPQRGGGPGEGARPDCVDDRPGSDLSGRPLDPGDGRFDPGVLEYKFYAPDVGLIRSVVVKGGNEFTGVGQRHGDVVPVDAGSWSGFFTCNGQRHVAGRDNQLVSACSPADARRSAQVDPQGRPAAEMLPPTAGCGGESRVRLMVFASSNSMWPRPMRRPPPEPVLHTSLKRSPLHDRPFTSAHRATTSAGDVVLARLSAP